MAEEKLLASLAYDVIVKDKDLDKQLNDIYKKAEKFNTDMSKILDITAKISTKQVISTKGVENARELSNLLGEINKKLGSMPSSVKVSVQNEKELANETARVNDNLLKGSGLMSEFAKLTGIALGAAGVKQFVSSLVRVTGEFEVQKMALGSMLQDVNKADQIFGELRQKALESPYSFQDLTKYAKQLTAFNIDADQLVETERRLADVAAGLGVDMGRIILAYGQVKAAGVLKGTELRQFTEAGVPLLQSLADQIERTTGNAVGLSQIFDMISKKQIPFAMVEQAFKDMTDEGGKFYKMQEVLVETLQGKIQKLGDTWQQALYDLGQSNSGILKGTVDLLTYFARNLETIGKVLAPLIAAWGAYKVALATAVSIQKLLLGAETIAKLLKMTEITNKLAIAFKKVTANAKGTAAAFGAIGLAATAIILITSEIIKATGSMAKFRKELQELHDTAERENGLDEEAKRVEFLNKVIHDSAISIDARRKAIADLQTIIPSYIANLTTEGRLINENTAAINAYIEAKRRESKQKAYEDIQDKLNAKKAELELERTATLESHKVGENYTAMGFFEAISYANRGRKIKEIEEDLERVNNTLKEIYAESNSVGKVSGDIPEWMQKVRGAINKVDQDLIQPLGLEYRADDDYFKYVDRLGKQYDSIRAKKDKALESDKAVYEHQLNAIKAIDKALGGNIIGNSKTGKRDETKAERDSRIARENLKDDIRLLETFKKAYDRLVPYTGEENIGSVLKAIFDPTGEKGYSFADIEGDIVKLLEQLEKLGPEGQQAAEQIAASLGLDKVSQKEKEFKKTASAIEKATKEAEKFRETMLSLEGKAEGTSAEGVFYKIGKAAEDLKEKLETLKNTERKLRESLAGIDASSPEQKSSVISMLEGKGLTHEAAESFWNEFIAGGDEAIYKLMKKFVNKAKSDARNKVYGLAADFIEEQFTLKGLDVKNLSQKTIPELRKIRTELQQMQKDLKPDEWLQWSLEGYFGPDWMNATADQFKEYFEKEKDGLTDSQKAWLQYAIAVRGAEASIVDMTGKLDSALQKHLQNLDPAEKKSLGRAAKWVAKEILGLAGALEDLADATGNRELATFTKVMSGIGQNLEAAAAGYQATGSWIGAVVGGVLDAVKQIVTAVSAFKKANKEIAESVVSAKAEIEKSHIDDILGGSKDSIFGEDSIQRIEDAVAVMDRAKRKIQELGTIYKYNLTDLMWLDTRPELKALLSNPEFVDLRVRKGAQSKSMKSISDIAADLGLDLYDEYNNINPELLRQIDSLYGKLNEDAREWLINAATYGEEYAEAMKSIEEVTKSLMDQIASSAADNIVDQWIEAGDAALDYADILDDVARAYAKMLVQHKIMDEVFDDETTAQILKLAQTPDKSSDLMSLVASKMEDISNMAPAFDRILESFRPYFQSGEGESSSLGSGIKGITEDTANLLASYINAMRADVSVIRSLQENGWMDVKAIRDGIQGGFAAPNYNEYMAQIAANTENSLRTQEAILSKLKDIITSSPKGGSAVRIYS